VSNLLFPQLVGAGFVTREPIFSTNIKTSTSGNEIRLAQWTFARSKWTIPFQYLSDWNNMPVSAAAQQYIATLQGFYEARFGSFDSFLFYDETDSVSQSAIIGDGNGSTTQFQLYRSYGSGQQPVFDLNATTNTNIGTYGINSIKITDGGTGYSYPPTVVFTGGGGSGARAIASVSGGAVDAIFLQHSGTGYTSAPSVSFVGGGGSSASATASVTPVIYLNGSVASGYSIGTTGILTFNSPPGNGVQITADLSYLWRARFDSDSLEFVEIAQGFWQLKKVTVYGCRS
jgi:uncharacterized protein (TIGR02217 family)